MEITMKKTLLASVALLGIVAAGAASAADLPRRTAPAAPYAAMPVFTWTGFYIGLNAGYNWSDNKSTVTFNPSAAIPAATGVALLPGRFNTGGDGFIGGGQIGYNYQMGQFVVGLEADISFLDNKKNASFVSPLVGNFVGVSSAQSELEYLGTVRGRLGFAFDRALVYATGGLAYGEIKSNTAFTVNNGTLNWAGSKSDTRTGYAVGGGIEYAFTNNLSAKVEYLYYDLGKYSYRANPVNPAALATGASYDIRQETKGSIVRAGLNYRF
jgi:outer membrane immunogenic protein